ncbi:hypothetical protein J437_LFUL002923 [Ladona fulva]|uniref:Microtubule-associated protein Jupiter n=1 Tax=Ladona fulva TaxID=123851 RepID=A0A8K0KAR4_LADFU|nr:hypothetical protein J437_LFUL002923 [Ladona fulva]
MSSTFYAAFRHVELDNIGYGKRRVLKPPGGGSSDIFGGEEGNSPQARPVKNHLRSSLFTEPPSTPTTNGNSDINSNGTTNGTTNGHATTPKGNKYEGRNPVTGEGLIGDERDSSHVLNNQPKQRVPPGGYTTPLW